MSSFIVDGAEATVPIWPVAKADYEAWLSARPETERRWLVATEFKPEAGAYRLIADAEGGLAGVVLGLGERPDLWCYGGLAKQLPKLTYRIETAPAPETATAAALGWSLGAYGFSRYLANETPRAQLLAPQGADLTRVERTAAAVFLVRDLINTPAGDLGPGELAEAVEGVARRHGASTTVIVGDDLLAENYPMVHAVGRASARLPRLIDLRWGDQAAPKVTLIGKGVCFDSGGLDIKTAAGMLRMKKDMGGAANALGLAQMIMAAGLPVRLRLLIPAVENAISGDACRPGDVLPTREGRTVEIGNTDAEGRLILCDALAEADAERPQLLVDMATLTGAARVAVGPDLPALFTDDDALASALAEAGRGLSDPVWRMPLFEPYAERLKSGIADLNNVSDGPQAGAITAALYLKAFVTETPSWAHLDLYAWNDKDRPGRPAGGEAQAIRALYQVIEQRFG